LLRATRPVQSSAVVQTAFVASGGRIGASSASGVTVGMQLSWSSCAACLQRRVGVASKGLSRLAALVVLLRNGEGRRSLKRAAGARANSEVLPIGRCPPSPRESDARECVRASELEVAEVVGRQPDPEKRVCLLGGNPVEQSVHGDGGLATSNPMRTRERSYGELGAKGQPRGRIVAGSHVTAHGTDHDSRMRVSVPRR